MSSEFSWACSNCKCVYSNRFKFCTRCRSSKGEAFKVVNASQGSLQKYEILGSYIPELSKIMRANNYEHYFIDACAGSGVVYDSSSGKLIDGSPLIFAKVREHPRAQVREPEGKPEAKCIFIEYDDEVFRTLKHYTHGFPSVVDRVKGDCNIKLDEKLDEISSSEKQRNQFAFVYIDPFGFGTPTISLPTIERVLRRQFTELFLHFTWEGVSRLSGFAYKHISDNDSKLRNQAEKYKAILDGYLGEEWWEIEKRGLSPSERRREYITLYESTLRKTYPQTLPPIGIPTWERDPAYYLFFATRNEVGREIMKRIMDKVKRRGAPPLRQFF